MIINNFNLYELLLMSIYAFPIKPNDLQQTLVYYKSALTEDECNQILQVMESKESIPGEIVSSPDTNELKKDVRNVAIKFVEYEDLPFIYDKLSMYVADCNQSHFNVDLIGFMEQMQLLHYGEDIGGGHYNWHVDNGPGLSTRKLTVIVQLSKPENYTGCELEVSAIDYIPKEQGSIIVFPSYTPHRVTKLLTGERNALVVWVNGPPYR